MSVKKEPSGRRSIQVEVEVPGTPEEVWRAIATGPGVTAWFVPAQIEERMDGKMTLSFGPGMDSDAKITAWDPPRSFAAESNDFGPNSPAFATEWIIEARSGGTCLVRVVNSLFTSTDDWDGQLGGLESGWPAYFRVLRLYMTHFRGQTCRQVQVLSTVSTPMSKAWDEFSKALGLETAAAGVAWDSRGDVPPLGGIVEARRDAGDHRELLMRLEKPAPGAAVIGAFNCGGPVQLMLSLYLYGDATAGVVARDEPAWQNWMADHFPPPNPDVTA